MLEKAREIERRHALSWWDSMTVAAAQLQNCEVLLSEDLQHGWTWGTLTVRNPFADRIEEAQPSYAAFAAHSRGIVGAVDRRNESRQPAELPLRGFTSLAASDSSRMRDAAAARAGSSP
jgi:hypothetical protein